MMIDRELEEARRHSAHHRKLIEKSEYCICFYCLTKYPPKHITRWLDEESTAVCPRCGIDAVIPSCSGVNMHRDFMRRMQKYWFGRKGPDEEV